MAKTTVKGGSICLTLDEYEQKNAYSTGVVTAEIVIVLDNQIPTKTDQTTV